jgi:Spy/CpxP family protein refolding chaperone
MNPPVLIPTLTAAFIAFSSLSAAEKAKAPSIADYPFWTAKKRGNVAQLVPGLNAVLQLTDAQRDQIAAAREEMSNDEAVQAARRISKSDPNVTPEQREKARTAIENATTRLRDKVATILTPEQKELIEKINAAYAAAVEDMGIVYADKFASVKADEAARRRIQEEKNQDTEEQFLHKLDGILTASQREAMTRAAEEEERLAASAAVTKKPAKP